MLIKNESEMQPGEVTPKSVYLDRRSWLLGVAGAFGASRALGSLLSPDITAHAAGSLAAVKSPLSINEEPTTIQRVTNYNNFYEFGTEKTDPAAHAKNFRTSPWSVSVEGLVAKPQTYDLAAIMKLAPLEERVYRHRCVERWSIVVPWIGYSLSTVLKLAEPTAKAKYVAFQSYYDPKQMPAARYAGIDFPYVEGLRLDEAMHPLALLCFGMYGEPLPNQDGAPIRLAVPWKYGFKSIKSIVKIKLVEKQPPTTWNLTNANEYGFYSNVNPKVDHPRWSQAKERRLGEFSVRDTLMFNGYGDQVASLYNGMDLKKYY